MTILMREEKQTKNTVRFAEEAEAPKIGTLYVPKATLQEIGYKPGMLLRMELKAAPELENE